MQSSPPFFSTIITGIGAVSAAGKSVEEFWQRTLRGEVRAELGEFFPPRGEKKPLRLPVYRAELPPFSKKEQHLVRRADRTAYLLLAAAREAWEMGQLDDAPYEKSRIGIVIGSSRGPMMLQEEQATVLKQRPSTALYSSSSSMTGILATALAIEGPSFTVASSCTSGATALAIGQQLLQSGMLDLVLVAGVDAPLTYSLVEQYLAAGVLSTYHDPCMALRPFDRDRSGTVLGEGAAVVLLESEKMALQRQAPMLAALNAVALQNRPDCRAALDPEGEALQQVMQQSLEQAMFSRNQIAAVHLHGTGTTKNDLIESRAISSFFRTSSAPPIASANKALTGHLLGASPLFQLLSALLTLQHGWIPPVTHCEQLDPACDLRISRGESLSPAPALCLNSGFWGNVSSIVISPWG